MRTIGPDWALSRRLSCDKSKSAGSSEGIKVAVLKVAEIFGFLDVSFQNSVSPEEQRRADTPPAFRTVFVRPARRLPRVTSGPSVAGCPVATFRPKG